MIGNTIAVAYNPTCDDECPEDCLQPWKIFPHQRPWWASEIDLFALPRPQMVFDNWTIDESFKITGGMIFCVPSPIP